MKTISTIKVTHPRRRTGDRPIKIIIPADYEIKDMALYIKATSKQKQKEMKL